jgi:hypothetical protein
MLWLLVTATSAQAGTLERAYDALQRYDYFKAKKLLQRCSNRQPTGSGYGLALIYYRKDNPFSDNTRAHNQILSAKFSYPKSTSAQKKRLLKLGVDYYSIKKLEAQIDSVALSQALQTGLVVAMDTYLEVHCNSRWDSLAIVNRDAFAFRDAEKINSYPAYNDFMLRYPKSLLFQEAQSRYDRVLFETKTADSSLVAYELFVTEYPDSPYRGVAEDAIFKLSVGGMDIDSYRTFIRKHPTNRNKDEAWMKLYSLYTADGSSTTIAQFWIDYPDFPFKETITEDLRLSMTEFYPIRDNGLWGFADSTGSVLIPCEYEWVEIFQEGAAAVGKNGKAGFINKRNKSLVAVQYDEVSSFRKGVAVVELDQKFGLVDKAGFVIVPVEYDAIYEFSEGRAGVERNGKHGYIDQTGKEVVRCMFEKGGDFSGGLAYVQDSTGYGFIDRYGKIVVPTIYEWVGKFNNGIARVQKNDLFGLIDAEGKYITACEYEFIGEFNDNRALVVQEGRCGYINRAGELVIPMKYDYYRALLGDNSFKNGTAKVLLENKLGIIDTAGKSVVAREYEDVGIFGDNRCPIKKKGKWGFIDHQVKLVIPYDYEYAWSFTDGVARVRKDGLVGCIDVRGKWILQATYNAIDHVAADFLVLETDSGKGLADVSGNIFLYPVWDKIAPVSGAIFRVERNSKFAYYNVRTRQFQWKEKDFVL